MTRDETLARGARARAAMEEFVTPAVEGIRAEYLARLTEIAANEPWNSDKIVKLAIASRVIDAVESHLANAIMAGRVEQQNAERARQIEDLPAHKRRWI